MTEKVNGEQANKFVGELFKHTKWAASVSLDDVYKTAYGAYDDVDILYYKNSFVSQDQKAWLAKVGQPAHFTAPAGGISAALLIHGEMHGVSAMKIVNITHEHYYSAENMIQACSKLFKDIGLGSIDNISEMKEFRAVLKEANSRGNSIFS